MQFDAGSQHLVTAGTAVQFKALKRTVKAITFHARSTNTGLMVVGPVGVVSTNGYELTANQSLSFTFNTGSDQLTDFWLNATTTTDLCDFAAVLE